MVQALKRKNIRHVAMGDQFTIMLGKDVTYAELQKKREKRRQMKEAAHLKDINKEPSFGAIQFSFNNPTMEPSRKQSEHNEHTEPSIQTKRSNSAAQFYRRENQ